MRRPSRAFRAALCAAAAFAVTGCAGGAGGGPLLSASSNISAATSLMHSLTTLNTTAGNMLGRNRHRSGGYGSQSYGHGGGYGTGFGW